MHCSAPLLLGPGAAATGSWYTVTNGIQSHQGRGISRVTKKKKKFCGHRTPGGSRGDTAQEAGGAGGWVRVGGPESQFLGKVIRSQGPRRRREGSGALKEEIGVWSSQGGERNTFFFPLYSLVLVTCDVFFFKPRADKTTQLQLCTKDFIYKTTVYPA